MKYKTAEEVGYFNIYLFFSCHVRATVKSKCPCQNLLVSKNLKAPNLWHENIMHFEHQDKDTTQPLVKGYGFYGIFYQPSYSKHGYFKLSPSVAYLLLCTFN